MARCVAKSEALFQEMVGAGHPPFSTIGLVEGIDNGGGMQAHTCLLGSTPTECYYVNPAAAQGANWWATTNPDGGAIASGEAPLPAPFYVVERDGYEERHWMTQDTGYPTHVSARRLIGGDLLVTAVSQRAAWRPVCPPGSGRAEGAPVHSGVRHGAPLRRPRPARAPRRNHSCAIPPTAEPGARPLDSWLPPRS